MEPEIIQPFEVPESVVVADWRSLPRNVDADVASARARVAVATRNGDAAALLEAKADLALANEARREKMDAERRVQVAAMQKRVQEEQTAVFAAEQRWLDLARVLLDDPTDYGALQEFNDYSREQERGPRSNPAKTAHNIVERAGLYEAQEFKQAHGPSRVWDAVAREDWLRMISRHQNTHRAIRCPADAGCTGTQARIG